MKVGKGECYLGGEELGLVLGEHSHLDKVAEELATVDEFHEEVNAVLVLEHKLHVDQEWVVNRAEDVLLKLNVLHLLVLEDDVLADDLHSVQPLVRRVLDEEDLAEGAFANHLLNLKVGKRGLHVVLAGEQSS